MNAPSATATPARDEERDEVLRLVLELNAAICLNLIRIGLSEQSRRLMHAATSAVFYLTEIAPGMQAGERESSFSSALSCMVEIASGLDLFPLRKLLPEQEFNRLRILAIRGTHRLSRLASLRQGLLRVTHPSLRGFCLAS